MDSFPKFPHMDSKILRLALLSLLLLVNSIAAAPGGMRHGPCVLPLQENGEVSAQSVLEFERCRANLFHFRVDTRATNPLSMHERTDDATSKCLLVIEASKSILEPEVYERLRSCYEDKVCSQLMGPCDDQVMG